MQILFFRYASKCFKLRRPAFLNIDCRRPPSLRKPFRLLPAYDRCNTINFLIDTGSAISVIQAKSREKSRQPDEKVLNSATSNEIHTFGDKNLNVKFNASGEYPWKFTVTNLNFSVIGIDFLTAYKLTVDPSNFCLVDKINNRIKQLNLKQLNRIFIPEKRLLVRMFVYSSHHQRNAIHNSTI